MRYSYLLLVAFFFLVACKRRVPNDIISEDVMASMLTDIHVADGYLNTVVKPDSAKILAASYYKGIYKKYGVDEAQYNRSLDFYVKHPEILIDVYKNVTLQLDKDRVRLTKEDDARRKKEMKKLDTAKVKKALPVATPVKNLDSIKKAAAVKTADSLKKVMKQDSVKKVGTKSKKKKKPRKRVKQPAKLEQQ